MMKVNQYSRAQWPRLLCALPDIKVREIAQACVSQHQIEDIAIPQSGLALLQIYESALGDNYYLGEIALARAHVRITSDDGQKIEGAAQIMDDRKDLAQAIAVLDAVLAAQLTGWEDVYELLQQGDRILEKEMNQRRMLLSTTKVDFSTLDDIDKSNDHD